MTQTPHPPGKSRVEAMDSDELTALYREGCTVEPDRLLDQRILAAAKAELASDQRRHRVSRPWWKVLLVPATTVAVGVLGISLAWRVVDQQEHELRATMQTAEAPVLSPEAPVGKVLPSTPPQLAAAPAPLPQREEKEAKSDRAPVVETAKAFPEQKPEVGPGAESEKPVAESSRRVARTPEQTGDFALKKSLAEATKDSAHEGSDEVLSGQVDSPSAAPAPMPAARASRDDRATEKASGAAMEAAAAPDDAATPEDWLKRIRELRAAGREAEAARSLARFRLRHPDHLVPSDLVP